MSWIKEVRKAFGLSQEFMATLLQTKRSNVNQAEMGRRHLRWRDEMEIQLLFQVIEKGTEMPEGVLLAKAEEEQRPKTGKKLRRKFRTFRSQAEALKLKLEDMQEKCKRFSMQLKAVDAFRAKHPQPLPESARYSSEWNTENWFALLEVYAMRGIEKYGPATQKLLELQISTLEFAATKAEELANSLEQ